MKPRSITYHRTVSDAGPFVTVDVRRKLPQRLSQPTENFRGSSGLIRRHSCWSASRHVQGSHARWQHHNLIDRCSGCALFLRRTLSKQRGNSISSTFASRHDNAKRRTLNCCRARFVSIRKTPDFPFLLSFQNTFFEEYIGQSATAKPRTTNVLSTRRSGKQPLPSAASPPPSGRKWGEGTIHTELGLSLLRRRRRRTCHRCGFNDRRPDVIAVYR